MLTSGPMLTTNEFIEAMLPASLFKSPAAHEIAKEAVKNAIRIEVNHAKQIAKLDAIDARFEAMQDALHCKATLGSI